MGPAIEALLLCLFFGIPVASDMFFDNSAGHFGLVNRKIPVVEQVYDMTVQPFRRGKTRIRCQDISIDRAIMPAGKQPRGKYFF